MEIAFLTNTIEYERIWQSFDTAPVSMCGGNVWLFWIQIKPKNYWEFPAHDRKVVERQHHEIMQAVLKTGELQNGSRTKNHALGSLHKWSGHPK